MTFSTTVFVSLLFSTQLLAAAAPKPSVEAEKLAKLMVGDWSGSMSVVDAKGKDEKFTAKLKCSTIALGSGVLCEFTTNPQSPSGAEIFLAGYDKKDGFIHFFELEGDSAHDHIGKWEAETLVVMPMPSEAKACILKEMRVKRLGTMELLLDGSETTDKGDISFTIPLKRKPRWS